MYFKKEEGRRKKEEGRRKKEEGKVALHKCAWDFNSFVEWASCPFLISKHSAVSYQLSAIAFSK
ncbi:MAG: hypothetical protein F6K39_38555 [Okeania sp. SIO3B3]|nr:hypothetical protein [Okeania sp. SIO3B3]